ncbi:MAG: pilus assembly protein HicB [Prevotella koreensis]|uniref:pilus assembly protein HicB n=1 Tax=Prevotella koreensis TaxID=2490854 RepID=UPI003FA06844
MKAKRLVIVERGRGKRNFSCFATEDVNNCGLVGYGTTAREAMEDIMETVKEYRQMAQEKHEDFPDVEFEYRFDIGAFFDYYPLDITSAAKYIGINPSVLRQYVTALRTPKQTQIDKIREGLARLSKDLGSGLMIEKPVTSYV